MENEHFPVVGGSVLPPHKSRKHSAAKTMVFTCAQNNTLLHDGFWTSLTTYCAVNCAELHVSRITYNKAGVSAGMAKPGSKKGSDEAELWYDERITPYISDESLYAAPGLVWCGELNILPTKVHPLASLKEYTGPDSGIVPHVKLAMESIPTMKNDRAKFMYTTGTVTQRNYIQKIAGQVAEFHHVFGALVVEVDDNGQWWARQINADADGGFYDLTTYYKGFDIVDDQDVLAIVHGDIHTGKAKHEVLGAVFGSDGVVDRLKPQHQFIHDVMDFTGRNHHNIKDPHFMWLSHMPVQAEFVLAGSICAAAAREWSTVHVVTSNHDTAIGIWLKNTDGFRDRENVQDWLEANLAIASGRVWADHRNSVFAWALKEWGEYDGHIIAEDDSFILAGVQFGLHGHLGPNGARGSPRNLRILGKCNTAHTHSAGIVDGVYTAGVYGNLDMGYNKGPSSWSHSAIIQYKNGKRAILTMSKDLKMWRDE